MAISEHRKMSALMIATVTAAICAASLSAATYTVANGESLTLDASSNNQAGNQITLENGATLVAPVSGDGYRIDANVYVAGAARIDLASTPTSAFYLRIAGGLAAKDDSCSLTIGGGRTEVFFGLQNVDRSPIADIAADGTGISYPIINLKNLYFDDTSRGTFHLRANSACTVIQLPTTCDFKINTNVTLALKGADALAPLGQSNPYSITNFNAVVLDRAAIPAGSTVKVGAGRTLAVKPCGIYDLWDWGGVEQELNFNVELEGDDSLLLFRTINTGWTRFVGNITGAGKVYVRGENNSKASRVLFGGDIACKGGLQTSSVADVRFGPDAGWRSRVKHWFDAADESSYVLLNTTPPSGKSNVFPGGYPALVGWKDTLKGTNDVFCYNTRIWMYDPPSNNYVLQVVPYVVTNGLNGLNYVSFGTAGDKVASAAWGIDGNATEARRLPFWKGEADGKVKAAGAAATSECKYAIMVFGSQQGGGYALLGAPTTSAGRLTRNPTTNDTWLGSNAPNYDFTVDGETVNPGTAKPNGAWQIVSIDMTRKATTIDSLGAQTASGSSATASGGQNYAEVILFESAPTEAERRACERYLAKKWGLAGSYAGGLARDNYRLNSASDETAVTVVGDVKLTGVYEGALNVDDHSTVSFTRSLPQTTEADLPSDGRVGWFDPEFEPTRKMRTTNPNRPLELDGILCRTVDGVDTTRGWMGGARVSDVQNRSPWIDESSHNGGPVRHWIDFRDKYDKTYDTTERIMGNMLRYRTASYSEDVMKNTSSTTFGIRQAFMVLDTSAGGGTPLLDKSNASGVVRARYGTTRPGDNYSKSIHANGERKTVGVFLGGKAWLNKAQVDPYTHGFTGKPEILTLETTGDFPVGFLAYYGERDGYRDGNYEIMGETIFYSAPLSDEDRAKVQDYLMYKWLGKMDGAVYSDATAATLSGAGTVTAASIDDEALPNLSSFTGTLALSGGLSLVVGETKTLACAVSLPKGCTISVEVPDGTADGTYTLLEAASIDGFDGATVVLTGDKVDKYKAVVTCDGGIISVKLRIIRGLTLILR